MSASQTAFGKAREGVEPHLRTATPAQDSEGRDSGSRPEAGGWWGGPAGVPFPASPHGGAGEAEAVRCLP